MNFKFVLDENMTMRDEGLPANIINVRELYYQNGLRQFAIEDREFMRLATKLGYTIITKDKGLVIKVNQSGHNVVYVEGSQHGKKWYLIPSNKRVSNRKKLQEFITMNV